MRWTLIFDFNNLEEKSRLRQCSRFLRSGMTKEIGQLEFRFNFHILVSVL